MNPSKVHEFVQTHQSKEKTLSPTITVKSKLILTHSCDPLYCKTTCTLCHSSYPEIAQESSEKLSSFPLYRLASLQLLSG